MTTTRVRLAGAIALMVALAGMLGPHAVTAQTPQASPAATVDGVALPEGPLGEQIQWLIDTANAGPGRITTQQIFEHVDPAFFEETSMTDVFTTLADLQSAGITYELDPMIITTRDQPPSHANFVLVGSDGSRTKVSMQVNPASGLIAGLTVQPEGGATPEASPAT